MSQLQRITDLAGAGTYPHLFLPKLRQACDDLGATANVLTTGVLEMNRATFTERTRFGQGGVTDVSPLPEEIQNAIGFSGSDEVALMNQDAWYPLAHRMVDKTVEAHLSAHLADGQCLWIQGVNTGHGRPADLMLRELKRSLPRQFTVVHSTMPDNVDKRERVRTGYELFLRLKDEGLVETTLLNDNLSPFARTFNLGIQDRFTATALASLIAGQAHFSRNPSLAEVGRSLGDYGAFVGLALASRGLVVGKEPAAWAAGRKLFGLPARGSGNLENALLVAKETTRQALTEEHSLVIEETIDLRKPFFLVYTVPMAIRDRKWIVFSNQIRTWLANTYPTAIPVFASGNGTPDPRRFSSYWLQVSALFPMPDVPAPIGQLLRTPSLKRRQPRAGTPPPRNGHGPDPRRTEPLAAAH